jgi:hypothetical protein
MPSECPDDELPIRATLPAQVDGQLELPTWCGPPRLVLVREPDELGVERAHPELTLGARLVELAEANGHVADDDRALSRLDDDHLLAREGASHARTQATRWREAERPSVDVVLLRRCVHDRRDARDLHTMARCVMLKVRRRWTAAAIERLPRERQGMT